MATPERDAKSGSRFPRLLGAIGVWLLLASAWGVLGTQLDLNGPLHPATGADIACGVLFLASVGVAIPIGVALRRHRFVTLLWLAGVAIAAEEFWYVATMFASSDPTSDDTAVVGAFVSSVPLYGLLLGLLALGMSVGRLLERRRARPGLQPTASP